ncbi:SH3 domain-containing protein [Deinococcus sp. SDU3-2]|uniref:SH3 domain-containing protein n=1 Tax=Deinococcus terrestris TaxID=2651870 RepID=A0A7X1NYY4_9DEIO|nr:excalibur calcium-binding domain-containing protein [Deinococcus terrestris]MPY67941.1 SH3 domain-containing protein [Deinococcus terrestris]
MRTVWMAGVLAALTVAEAATATTTTDVVLRRSASATSARVAVVPKGTTLTMACSGQWCRTTHRGQSGYVSRTYVRVTSTATNLQAPALPAQRAEVYYANCSAARAAGAAPISRGEPGYRSRLDRDNDGVACE